MFVLRVLLREVLRGRGNGKEEFDVRVICDEEKLKVMDQRQANKLYWECDRIGSHVLDFKKIPVF